MAHPFSRHGENAVGHRRAKFLTTGKQYARGGHADEAEDKKLIKKEIKKYETAEKATGGPVNGSRLDKRARGGAIQKFQMGGPIRKITPSKHKPHVGVNIVNIHRPAGGGGMGMRPRLGGGLPVAPPVGGAMPPPMPGMKRGGSVQKKQVGGPAVLTPPVVARPPVAVARPVRRFAKGGATMRKGKKYGEGSGEGRLEEFHHMRGK